MEKNRHFWVEYEGVVRIGIDVSLLDIDSARVDAKSQTEAFKEAQENMEKSASEDAALLSNAQESKEN